MGVTETETFLLVLSGRVKIVAGGDTGSVSIEVTENQLRSLAYHAARAVEALDRPPVEGER